MSSQFFDWKPSCNLAIDTLMESIERPTGGSSAPENTRSDKAGRGRSDVKREKIVRSAAKLFLERGYDSVSINDIIDVVGIKGHDLLELRQQGEAVRGRRSADVQ